MPIPFLDLAHQHREVEPESRAALARDKAAAFLFLARSGDFLITRF